MCIATAALIVGGIGAATAATGMIVQGQAQAKNARFQSQVAANNAAIAEENAKRATLAGDARTQAIGLKTRAREGLIRAAIASNGVDVNSGSALDVQTGERETGRYEELSEQNKAALEAYGYRTQGSNFTAESQLRRAEASQAITGSVLGATGSLLRNASSLGFRWGGTGGGVDGYGSSASDIVWDT